MSPEIHELTFNGGILELGFWLFVWEITTPEKDLLYYVGRTGDSSTVNSHSPFNRIVQLLSINDQKNALRTTLDQHKIEATECDFRLVAYGPILKQAATFDEHTKSREIIGGLESKLINELRASGYTVFNTLNRRKPLENELWPAIRKAFESTFPNLKVTGKEANEAP
jgi:hypothetical protein